MKGSEPQGLLETTSRHVCLSLFFIIWVCISIFETRCRPSPQGTKCSITPIQAVNNKLGHPCKASKLQASKVADHECQWKLCSHGQRIATWAFSVPRPVGLACGERSVMSITKIIPEGPSHGGDLVSRNAVTTVTWYLLAEEQSKLSRYGRSVAQPNTAFVEGGKAGLIPNSP